MTTLRHYWHLIRLYVGPQKGRVALLASCLLASTGLALVMPQILRRFIDAAGQGAAAKTLLTQGLAFLAVAVLSQALSFLVTYLSETVAWQATNQLRYDLALHCLRLDLPFHKVHMPGELIERIDGDVQVLGGFFSQMAVRIVAEAATSLGIVALLWREDRRVGLAGLLYAILTFAAMRAVGKPVVKAWGALRQADADLFGFLGERITGTEDIKANGGVAYVMQRFFRLMRAEAQKWMGGMVWQSISVNLNTLLFLATQIVALALSIGSFMHGVFTIGTVYLVVHYIGMLRGPLAAIQWQIGDLQRASASIMRVEELLAERTSVTDHGQRCLPEGALPVVFDDVSFRYSDASETADAVLRRVAFELEPGKVLGLLGRTGSGKSTLIRLLFRLYDPTEGRIRLDEADLREFGLSDVRQHIGLVTQDVQLFQATVRDNLTLFDRRYPDERLLEVLRELGLQAWYSQLPEGLDTLLQAGGRSLSAGEAQLLALARVMLKNPGLVILDEASSRLDPATEALLETAMSRLLVGRTAIIVAHRLATVQRADEIMILEDGQITELGNRIRLSADPASRFYRLLQTGLEEALA